MDIKSRKSFIKRFWWIGLIVLILVGFSFAWVGGHSQNKKTDDNTDSDKNQNPSLAEDLPACPADTSGLFTKAFMDGDKPDYIIPLGNSGMSSHVVPVDHMYPTDDGYEENVAIYAPGDLTLIWVENKQMHNQNTDEIIAADYQLYLAPCRGINLTLIHLKGLSNKLKTAIGDENSNCDSQKIDYGTQEGIPTYYVTCHPDFQKVRISAGEVIGYFSGHRDKQNSGFDIGIYNFNKPALAFVNPDRYDVNTLHTSCFSDYYVPELKAQYEAKIGGLASQGSDVQTFLPRTADPVCGQVMWDVAGTAQGNWFRNPIKQRNMTDNDALVLIHDNIKPDQAKFSMANITSFTFTPIHSGNINREFSEVTPDSNVYCYQSDNNGSSSAKHLLELVDDTHIKIENQSGMCGTSEVFNNPLIFKR